MYELLRWITACASLAVALRLVEGGAAQPRRLVLDNVRIIDGSGAAPIENGRIVIEGERIARVGPAAGDSSAERRRDESISPAAP